MKKQTVSSTLEGNGNIIDHPVIVVSTNFVKGDVWVVATQFAIDFQPYHWKKWRKKDNQTTLQNNIRVTQSRRVALPLLSFFQFNFRMFLDKRRRSEINLKDNIVWY